MEMILLWSIFAVGTEAFKPTIGQGDDPSMYTHESITLEGMDKAAADFLSSGLVDTTKTNHYEIIKKYFGSDTKSYQDYQQRGQEFALAVMNVYKSYHWNPDYTVNSERIIEADSLVQSTRLEIASILSKGTLDETSTKLLINKVGKCLMIIQSFYSNTNWIEMMVNGGESFLTFGTLASIHQNVATTGTATCRNCDDSIPNSCNNNLLVKNRLTSGYLYSQSSFPKPLGDPRATEGKCSHGGVNDFGRNTPATGGINKETPDWNWSPHAHLHNISGQTAVQATAAFFIDATTGLLSGINRTTITDVFKLKKPLQELSMGFVIDVTGSMANDINSLKNTLIDRLSAVIGTPNAPHKYVLSTFSDPANLTTIFVTNDGHEMIHKIERLTVGGGGDCPEYTLSGILTAINASDPYSLIYVATDADTKDTDMADMVTEEANAKHITLQFILTGNCSGVTRRRRDMFFPEKHVRQKRDTSNIFEQLAQSTGGQVYHVDHSEVTATLDHVLEKDFPSSKAIIDYFVQASTDSDTMNITVDSEAAVLVVTIEGPFSEYQASLYLPNGTEQSFPTARAKRYYSSHKITMSIQRPPPGIWNLTRLTSNDWNVNVTASTYLDIDSQLKEVEFGISYVVDRNPIIGKNYTLEVLVYSLNSSSSGFHLHLLDEQGTDLFSQPVDIIFSFTKITGYMQIVIPNKSFYVQLSGIDQNGFKFKRMSRKLTTPVGVDLFVTPILVNLDTGIPHNITYTLSNLGSSTQTYTVSITDDKGRLIGPISQQQILPPENSTTGNFQIQSPLELEFVTYTVSVKLSGSTDILQSSTSTVMFAGPVCSSIVSRKCRLANTKNKCSMSTWSATAIFSFEVATYISVQNVSMTIDPVNAKRLQLRGDCCQGNFSVTAKPSVGSGCETSENVVESDDQVVINEVVIPGITKIPETTTATPEITTTEIPELTTESKEVTTENTLVTTESTEVTTENTELTTENTELTTESTEVTTESTEIATKNQDVATKLTEKTTEIPAVNTELPVVTDHNITKEAFAIIVSIGVGSTAIVLAIVIGVIVLVACLKQPRKSKKTEHSREHTHYPSWYDNALRIQSTSSGRLHISNNAYCLQERMYK
ncbi:von Willebrand factor A domain-containing protein 7-like [Ylistrum balloti]|uniref:von Willebrand factor A domain-containing protein 7-like n=1 Tax=Ylistrum balloti TaxID=509963 RepID=UPI002905862C|nr:von Willebrand factor A domain-containing protein 7-like [Ylistrum balloti]